MNFPQTCAGLLKVMGCGDKYISCRTWRVTKLLDAVDLDMDGIPELLLGTHSGTVLIYSQKQSQGDEEDGPSYVELQLESLLTFAGPVCAVALHDYNRDGLDELVIVTTKHKVHVVEHRRLTGDANPQKQAAGDELLDVAER